MSKAIAESGTQRVVSLPGQDHASLALMPFAPAGERFRPLKVSYACVVDGQQRRIDFTLDPSAEVGLPLPADQLVFLALLQPLTEARVGERQVFRTRDLLRELGWSVGGRSYQELRQSLDRLVGLTLRVEETTFARTGEPYRRTAQALHVLDAYQLSSGPDEPSWVEWGLAVRQAVEVGDFKRLDWELAKSLSTPTAVQLYRFLDRVVLGGETRYEIDWQSLATAIGMSTNYPRAAIFYQKLKGHLAALTERGVLESHEYLRGGTFVFHLTNYLRSELRRVLVGQGVFPEAARKLVAGYDEARVLMQLDCLPFRGAREPGGYLTQAIRYGYPLAYPPEEREAFLALWELLLQTEREAYHAAALRLLGSNLFDQSPEPANWTAECRAVVRALVTHNLDPERV